MAATTVVKDAFDDPGQGNSSTYGIPDDTKQRDFDNEIHTLTPDVRPYTTMLMHPSLKASDAKSGSKVEWFQDDILPRIFAANQTISGSDTATTINVATGYGTYTRKGDIIKNQNTGELMLVTADAAADALTVTRGFGSGGTGIAFTGTTTSTDTLVRLSNASRQGDDSISVRMTVPSVNYNYIQIFRYDWSVTWSAEDTARQPAALNDEFAYQGAKKQKELKRDIELAIWEGKREIVTTASLHPRLAMGGLLSYISSNVKTISNATNVTLADFETAFRAQSRYSDGDVDIVAFASPYAMSALNSFPLGTLSPTSPDIKKYGVQVNQWQAGGLNVPLVVKRDWDDYPKASPSLGGAIALINMRQVRLRWFKHIKFHDNQQANDSHTHKGEYHCEVTLQVANEQTHGLIRIITEFACA